MEKKGAAVWKWFLGIPKQRALVFLLSICQPSADTSQPINSVFVMLGFNNNQKNGRDDGSHSPRPCKSLRRPPLGLLWRFILPSAPPRQSSLTDFLTLLTWLLWHVCKGGPSRLSPSVWFCVCVFSVHGLMSALPDTHQRSVLGAQAVLLLDKTSERSFSGNWILRRIRDAGRNMCVCVSGGFCRRVRACALQPPWLHVSYVSSLVLRLRLFAVNHCVFLRALWMSNAVPEGRGSASSPFKIGPEGQ